MTTKCLSLTVKMKWKRFDDRIDDNEKSNDCGNSSNSDGSEDSDESDDSDVSNRGHENSSESDDSDESNRGRGQRRSRGRTRAVGQRRDTQCSRRGGRGSRNLIGRGGKRLQSITEVLPSNAVNITDDFCPLRDPGQHLPCDAVIDPLALFELYFDDHVVERIIESTLAYAYHNKDDLMDFYCKFINGQFTKAELFCYFGALILLGIHGVRNHRYAGSIKKAQHLVRLSELLTCERYEIIGTFLHLVTPDEEAGLFGNKLNKILPIHNHIKSRCAEWYQPSRSLSIDERMVKSKARTHFRQYIRNKPTKWGASNIGCWQMSQDIQLIYILEKPLKSQVMGLDLM